MVINLFHNCIHFFETMYNESTSKKNYFIKNLNKDEYLLINKTTFNNLKQYFNFLLF